MPRANDVRTLDPDRDGRCLPDRLRDRIRSANPLLVCTDFDGTLAEITEDPDRASIRSDARRGIRALTAAPDTTVAVVSGRALTDVRQCVGVESVVYAGNHGLEIEVDDDRVVHPRARDGRATIETLCEQIRDSLADVDGVLVEDKGLTATVHYRMVDEPLVDRVAETVRDIAADAAEIEVTDGREILELRPSVDWDKGCAVEWITESVVGDRPAYRLYLGDDVSDETAFRALRDDEAAIRVGDRTTATAADHQVSDPARVATMLHSVAGLRHRFRR